MLVNKKEIEDFLEERDKRVTWVQILVNLYQEIGKRLSPVDAERKTMGNDLVDDGFIYQFFAFLQKPLVEMIYVNFITIIRGEFWKNILILHDEQEEIKKQLEEIKNRYAIPRDKVICHIDKDWDGEIDNVLTEQVIKDTKTLRHIFNKIREKNKLPPIGSLHDIKEEYPVLGLNKIFEFLLNPGSEV